MLKLFRAVLVWLAVLSTPAFADRTFMVHADWMAAEMKNPKLVILEVRYHPHRYHTVGQHRVCVLP